MTRDFNICRDGLAWLLLLILISLIVGCRGSAYDHSHGHGESASHEESFEHGPHGGRLLRKGDFAVELLIFEKGAPPQLRVFGYHDDKPVAPRELAATVRFTRLGGQVDEIILKPNDEFLTSSATVKEPHSFDVAVEVEHGGERYAWAYPSYEGRVVMSSEVAELSGVTSEPTQARHIRTVRTARGKIVPSEHRIAHVIPRFAGLVREGRKHIGDRVEKGEVMAVIESNQSLQPFEVRSQIEGTVVNGHLVVGEFVPENQWVYIVADISEVWADLFVPLRERDAIAKGQRVFITSVTGAATKEGRVSYVAPYADERAQAQLVRVVIPNEAGDFVPGAFITGEIVVSEEAVPVAIKRQAIQRFRDWQVVFVRVGDIYEVRPVTLGRSDGDWMEVHAGLTPGEEYVVGNSFLIKADILKAGASHDH
jgi:cobalt-zinc-cadmium efflux system membrane fusion protein